MLDLTNIQEIDRQQSGFVDNWVHNNCAVKNKCCKLRQLSAVPCGCGLTSNRHWCQSGEHHKTECSGLGHFSEYHSQGHQRLATITRTGVNKPTRTNTLSGFLGLWYISQSTPRSPAIFDHTHLYASFPRNCFHGHPILITSFCYTSALRNSQWRLSASKSCGITWSPHEEFVWGLFDRRMRWGWPQAWW